MQAPYYRYAMLCVQAHFLPGIRDRPVAPTAAAADGDVRGSRLSVAIV